jgi:hypothetical protein
MKAQFENKVMSSLLLFVDNYLLKQGEAFTNYSSLFYPVKNLYNSYYTYAAPFKQMVNDDNVPNAAVMKTIYVDGSEKNIGTSDFHGINHFQGQVYFTSDQGNSVISGNYAVKNFNVYLTNDPEQKLLFETKNQTNPKYPQQLSGLAPDAQPYPAIFIKNMGGTNKPFALGGLKDTRTTVRLVVLADSNYKLDAACSLLKDLHYHQFGIYSDLPFDAMGSYTGLNYNYGNLSGGGTPPRPFIQDVRVSKMSMIGDFNRLNPNVFAAFVDLDISSLRTP